MCEAHAATVSEGAPGAQMAMASEGGQTKYAPARGEKITDAVVRPNARVRFGRGGDGRRSFRRCLRRRRNRRSGGTAARRVAVVDAVERCLRVVRAILLPEPCFVTWARCPRVEFGEMVIHHRVLILAARHYHVHWGVDTAQRPAAAGFRPKQVDAARRSGHHRVGGREVNQRAQCRALGATRRHCLRHGSTREERGEVCGSPSCRRLSSRTRPAVGAVCARDAIRRHVAFCVVRVLTRVVL